MSPTTTRAVEPTMFKVLKQIMAQYFQKKELFIQYEELS